MKTKNSGFSWIPRILSLIIIVFIAFFALDVFNSEKDLIQQINDFFVHLIPVFLLIILLIIAWKRELIGGILFIVLSLVMSPFLYSMNYEVNHSMMISLGVILMITLPILSAGVLFVISSGKKNKKSSTNNL